MSETPTTVSPNPSRFPEARQVEMHEDGDGLALTFVVEGDGAEPVRIRIPADMAKRLGRHMRMAAKKILDERSDKS